MFSLPSSYKYRPLKPASQPDGQFRILTLLPGNKTSDIECSLQHVTFTNPPEYEALSYTWGDPKGPLSDIPVKGNPKKTFLIQLDGKRMRIKYNLEAALRQLRDENRSIVLWIDAICIDQTNAEERSEQVKAMAKIYNQASRAIVWLGETDLYTGDAFDAVEEVSWASKFHIWQYCAKKLDISLAGVSEELVVTLITSELQSDYGLSPFRHILGNDRLEAFTRAIATIHLNFRNDSVDAPRSKSGAAAGLGAYLISGNGELPDHLELVQLLEANRQIFFRRSYWHRTWIIQEIFNAARVLIRCGERCIDLDTIVLIFVAYSKFALNSPRELSANAEIDSGMVKLLKQLQHPLFYRASSHSKDGVSLSTNLDRYSMSRCLDGRDAIYALLSISLPIDIKIDYTKPTAVVWTETTKAIIVNDNHFDIMCLLPYSGDYTNSRRRPSKKLPSWVPPYDKTLENGELSGLGKDEDIQPYQGGGVIPEDRIQSKDIRVLHVYGWSLCRIKEVGDRILSENLDGDELDLTLDYFRELSSVSDLDDFWRLLVMDVYPNNVGRDERISTSEKSQSNLTSDISAAMMPTRLIERLKLSLKDKILCKTNNGELILVHGDPEVGDEIFIARGSRFPLVIRPTKGDRSYRLTKRDLKIKTFYRFAGGVYLHGRMDGEPLREMEVEGREEQTIFLI